MTHLSREKLIAWRDHPTDETRRLVVPHLAACATCAAAYAELIRARPASDAPAHLDPAAFAARARAMTPAIDDHVARTGARPARWLVPLAAAAVVLIAVIVMRDSPAPEPVLRGGASLRATSPSGATPQVTEFRWDAPAGVETYRVEVLDAGGATVFESRVTDARRLAAPADLAARLENGREYRWLVSRIDARGNTLESSPMTTFTIRR